MQRDDKIVIIGAGVFGLSLASSLASKGYSNLTILDRNLPPVPDGSSVDISRVIRFDYADEVYLDIARKAYQKWCQPKYKGIFYPTPFILTSNDGGEGKAASYIKSTTALLDKKRIPWSGMPNAAAAKSRYPMLTGTLATPHFYGYCNENAGWADASKAISQLRDDCIDLGVSFICGRAGTVTSLETDDGGVIRAAQTLAGTSVSGDHFVLAAGAWSSVLAPTYNSTLSTAQVIGYMPLSDLEMKKYQDLPIYINFSTGWFSFPPHADSKTLKMAVHGYGYTRSPDKKDQQHGRHTLSAPPMQARRTRANFVPADGETRLRNGLREILPELAERSFEKLALCWYNDTPTGDFVMDYHPDHPNLLFAGGGSGHAFKFLPVIGELVAMAFERQLPPSLAKKWRFHKEYENEKGVFAGDGSRGGPERRELRLEEAAKL